MSETVVSIRELKARLSQYLHRVRAGETVVITMRGQPVGRIMPVRPSLEARTQELARAGLVAWSGRKLVPRIPVATMAGTTTVADLLLEDRE